MAANLNDALTQKLYGTMEGLSIDSSGVPDFAHPWIHMGKAKEREKWQVYTMQLTEGAIVAELRDLKTGVKELVPQDSHSAVSSRLDSSHAKVFSLINDYKALMIGSGKRDIPPATTPLQPVPVTVPEKEIMAVTTTAPRETPEGKVPAPTTTQTGTPERRITITKPHDEKPIQRVPTTAAQEEPKKIPVRGSSPPLQPPGLTRLPTMPPADRPKVPPPTDQPPVVRRIPTMLPRPIPDFRRVPTTGPRFPVGPDRWMPTPLERRLDRRTSMQPPKPEDGK
eukprot:c16446_g1_i1 orf=315-1157(+)